MSAEAPTTTELREVVSAGGIRSVNFFNGRLLTAEDLGREQEARRAQREQLGRALGAGVVHGLEVRRAEEQTPPSVTVSAGLAINRRGRPLELPFDVTVRLVREAAAGATGAGGVFVACEPEAEGGYTAGREAYVLVVGPATGEEALAPAAPGTTACAPGYVVEGVKFRLLHLPLTPDPDLTDARAPFLRNRLAHLVYGTADGGAQRFAENAFAPDAEPTGLLDALPEAYIDAGEVPLATLAWESDAGIEFVDRWSVRRSPIPRPVASRWRAFDTDRRAGVAEAIFFQFQEHVEEVAAAGNVVLPERFELLPPVGLVPMTTPDPRAAFGESPALAIVGPEVLEGAHVAQLVGDALAYPPIDLREPRVVIRVYRVRENEHAPTTTAAAPYFVFTNAHVPRASGARADLAYADRASYSD